VIKGILTLWTAVIWVHHSGFQMILIEIIQILMSQIRRRSNNNIIAILIARLEQCSMKEYLMKVLMMQVCGELGTIMMMTLFLIIFLML